MRRKAISEIIAAALIVTITLSLTSTAYLWGAPLIEKRQQATTTERIFEQFSQKNSNSLPKIIEDVANSRGVRTFTINGNGILSLSEAEDSVEFTFTSKSSNIAANTQNPISLTQGVQCAGTSPPNSPSPAVGTQGYDSSSVVCAKAVSRGDIFEITYKIWFRELDDNPFSTTGTGFKIDLVKDPSGLVSSTGKTVTISFVGSSSQTVGNRILITKQIKILLI